MVQGVHPCGIPRRRRARATGRSISPSVRELGRRRSLDLPVLAGLRAGPRPFALLPFDPFYALWTVAEVAVLIWLVRPWPWALGILALPILYEFAVGQVHLFIAAAIVVGFRYPAAWALPILTKITPGIGLLWFLMRREWRPFAIAAGTTLAIVAISFVLSPSAWFEWIAFLTASTDRGEALYLRIAVGIALVAFGALTDRKWLVPVAVWIALPVVWVESWVILLAIIRLRPRATAPDAETATVASAQRESAAA